MIAWQNEQYEVWKLEIYSGLIMPIILLLLIGVNMYTWSRSHINYKFIFELNPRDNLDFRQYLEVLFIYRLYFDFNEFRI